MCIYDKYVSIVYSFDKKFTTINICSDVRMLNINVFGLELGYDILYKDNTGFGITMQGKDIDKVHDLKFIKEVFKSDTFSYVMTVIRCLEDPPICATLSVSIWNLLLQSRQQLTYTEA